MSYLYHFVPKSMEGSVLYPLNELKENLPEVYAKEVAKYKGREQVMRMRIPFLNCLWNDTLHFSAVDPREVKKALDDAGFDKSLSVKYYQIDPHSLDPKNTIVFLNEPSDDTNRMREENFVPYDPDTISKYAYIPDATKEYYREKISQGQSPLTYHLIPHILYKGAIDTSALEILSV